MAFFESPSILTDCKRRLRIEIAKYGKLIYELDREQYDKFADITVERVNEMWPQNNYSGQADNMNDSMIYGIKPDEVSVLYQLYKKFGRKRDLLQGMLQGCPMCSVTDAEIWCETSVDPMVIIDSLLSSFSKSRQLHELFQATIATTGVYWEYIYHTVKTQLTFDKIVARSYTDMGSNWLNIIDLTEFRKQSERMAIRVMITLQICLRRLGIIRDVRRYICTFISPAQYAKHVNVILGYL